MTLDQIYQSNGFVLSYELFPPKTSQGMTALSESLHELLHFSPDFITCTYGAGGSTREKTLETLALVQSLTTIPVASHLTCVGMTVDDLRAYLRRAAAQGIENIVAIRGDPPKGSATFEAVAGGLQFGGDLVRLIHDEFPHFGIAVGGYPEKHPESPDTATDIEHLKRKVDAGADVVITQLFYDNADFFRFKDVCDDAGIEVPIVPGILPVTSYAQIDRITGLCGARLPAAFRAALDNCGDDAEAQYHVGVDYATAQVADLVDRDVPGIHFYVLNKSRATCEVLGKVQLCREKR
jgi:methylenetetrahydrofolate reductase (NADPH)